MATHREGAINPMDEYIRKWLESEDGREFLDMVDRDLCEELLALEAAECDERLKALHLTTETESQ